MAGLPALGRNRLCESRTSFGSTDRYEPDGSEPAVAPDRMLPVKCSEVPVPLAADCPWPSRMLSASVSSSGGYFLLLSYQIRESLPDSVLNATTQWSADSWSVPL